MNWSAVKGVVFRHLYNFRHSLDRSVDVFYWPAMDIFLWGFTSVSITKYAGAIPQIVVVLLTGLVLWMVVWRGQYEITVNLLEEMWNQNLVNLFASPLRVREWMTGVFVLGVLKMLIGIPFAIFLSYAFYKANVFNLGFFLIPFMISLLLTGWAFGLIVSGFIIQWGYKIQNLAWSGIFLIAPFSGIYYPISTLPSWAQRISSVLPTSYIFEGMRLIILEGRFPWDNLVKSFSLNLLFLIFGVLFFVKMFEKSKDKGLARLE